MVEPAGSLDVERLGYHYPHAGTPALDGIDLQFPAGSFTLVLGSVGAGKSSLLMALNGVIPQLFGGVLEGRIRLDGADLADFRVQTITRFVGLVLQNPESQVVGRTVLEDVAFGPRNHQVPREEILRRVHGCLQLVGLDGLQDRETSQLSGGQLQRLAIAGILAMAPQVLCLDEPASELDPVGRREVYAAVDALRRTRRTTLVVAEHEPAEVVPRADRLVVLDQGRVSWRGAPADFYRDPDLVARNGLRPIPVTRICAPLVAAGLVPPRKMPLDVTSAERLVRGLAGTRVTALRPPVPTGSQPSASGRAVIEVQGLSHVYPSGVTGVEQIDLRVDEAEFVALVGPNGSGKTTLARHLDGLLRPTAGSVRVAGLDIAGHPTHELARQVGLVFQNPDHQIFCRSVAEEVGYGLRAAGIPGAERKRRVGEILELTGLSAQRAEHPLTLPRGQRQLVAVASVLALAPRILILDEPTTGLDWAGTCSLMRLVDRLHEQGTTILMLTHDMDLVAHHAQRVVALDAGRVAADGPTAQVLADRDLHRRSVLAPTQAVELCVRLWPGCPPVLDESVLGRHLLAGFTGVPR